MIGGTSEVEAFTDRTLNTSKRTAEAEYRVLLEAKRARDPAATAVFAWEQAYWAEKVRQAQYDFDQQQLRPYFGYRQVKGLGGWVGGAGRGGGRSPGQSLMTATGLCAFRTVPRGRSAALQPRPLSVTL